jgi:hypothetical protein
MLKQNENAFRETNDEIFFHHHTFMTRSLNSSYGKKWIPDMQNRKEIILKRNNEIIKKLKSLVNPKKARRIHKAYLILLHLILLCFVDAVFFLII